MEKIENSVYIVQEGDTIDSIAKRFGINPIWLLLKNNISPLQVQKGVVLSVDKDK